MKSKDGTVEVNTEEAIMFRAADKSAFYISINSVHNQIEYEEYCEILRSLIKPEIADMVIAIALDEMSVGEYAEFDLYRRVVWKARGKASNKWRCATRIQNDPGACDAETINKEELQNAVIRAINKTLGGRRGCFDTVAKEH